MSEATRDRFLAGRIEVLQPAAGGHRAGLDAVLLAAAVPDGSEGRLVDLGAGVGVAGLAAAARCPGLAITLVEIDPATAELARGSLALNPDMAGRARVVEADALDARALAAAGLPPQGAAAVILNPPFHPAGRARPSPDPDRARAHHAGEGDLERWIAAAARLCHPRGRVTAILRADETPALLAALAAARLGGIALTPVHPRAGAAASRVIATASPQSRAPFRLAPPLMLHEADGRWTQKAAAVLAGAALDTG